MNRSVTPHPKPFSFITWDEAHSIRHDHFCQSLWEWGPLETLWPPDAPYARLPWSEGPALHDVPDVGEDVNRRLGTVSVWCLRASHVLLTLLTGATAFWSN